MGNEVTIDPRYMKYNKAETEALLDKVNNQKEASEEAVRGIVKNWSPDAEPEPEPEPEEEEEESGE